MQKCSSRGVGFSVRTKGMSAGHLLNKKLTRGPRMGPKLLTGIQFAAEHPAAHPNALKGLLAKPSCIPACSRSYGWWLSTQA